LERITIIGMGPIGVSIGLALMKAKLKTTEIVGSSGDRDALSTASKIGAMDQAESNLRSAVRGASLIVLDLPLSQTKEILDAIAPIVESDAVITDTGTTKVRIAEWAEEVLPKGVSYVGGHPLIKRSLNGMEDSAAELFQGVDYPIMPSKSATKESVKTVVGMVELLGAKPLFLDPHEHDSYSIAMEVLPIVLSSALVTSTASSPSWREMHRLGASEYEHFTKLANSDPLDNEAECIANAEPLVHWIDEYIAALYQFRKKIAEKEEDLFELFINAWEERAKWEFDAVIPDDSQKLPSANQSLASAFLGERLLNRYKQMTGGNEKKSKSWEYRRRDG